MKIILLIFLFIIILAVLIWQFNLMLALIFGAPVVYSHSRAVFDAFKLAGLKPGETVIDLGCGNAHTLILAAKKFDAKGIGVERVPLFYWWSKFQVYLAGESQNIQIFYGDFKKVEQYLPKSNVIYLYLLNHVLVNMEDWLFTHIGPDTRIVSLSFKFAKHQPINSCTTCNLGDSTHVFLYKK